MRPPSASSQARVNGEKYALAGLVEVSTIEYANEAMTVAPRSTESRVRNDVRVQSPATIKNSVG